MAPAARPAPEAFRRGISAVVANPGLVFAPLAFAAATALAVGIPAFLLATRFAGSLPRFGSGSGLSRNLPAFLGDIRESFERLLIAPLALLLGLLALLALFLLLTALAAWMRAGVTGSLAAVDAHAAGDAPLSAFRLAGLGSVFFASARRLFGRFFALVNLYGLALSCLVLLLVLPAVLGVVAAASQRGLLVALAFALFALLLPVVIGGSIALRVLYLVAGRVAAGEEVDALEAVARAAAWTRASLPRVVVLYLLSLAASFVSGFAFFFPRLAVSFLAGHSFALQVAGTLLLVFAQLIVSAAAELAVTGSFVSLWPAPVQASALPQTPSPLV